MIYKILTCESASTVICTVSDSGIGVSYKSHSVHKIQVILHVNIIMIYIERHKLLSLHTLSFSGMSIKLLSSLL